MTTILHLAVLNISIYLALRAPLACPWTPQHFCPAGEFKLSQPKKAPLFCKRSSICVRRWLLWPCQVPQTHFSECVSTRTKLPYVSSSSSQGAGAHPFPFSTLDFPLLDSALTFNSSLLSHAVSASALAAAAEPNRRRDRSLPLPLVLH